MYTLEMITIDEAEKCYEILDDGRTFMHEQGFSQWRPEYPQLNDVIEDAKLGRGYALKYDDTIAGYMCLDFNGEPFYEKLDGKWNSNSPYVVIHRIAISRDFRGKGCFDITIALVEKLCKEKGINNIRIDTYELNKRMQHVLEKNGFKYTGIVTYSADIIRMAYDKTF